MKLDPEEIATRHYGITRPVAEAMVEAASVALARRHGSPTEATISDGPRSERATLVWNRPSERANAAWSDAGRATEWGAEALAVLAVERLRGRTVISRASRGTRVDFYVAREGESLESAILLEVAGTDAGSVRALLAEKAAQAAANPERLPAVAAVVGFREPRIMIADADSRP